MSSRVEPDQGRRRRKRQLVSIAVTAVMAAGALGGLAYAAEGSGSPAMVASASSSTITVTGSASATVAASTSASASAAASASSPSLDEQARTALATAESSLVSGFSGNVSVAALDLDTGATADYGNTGNSYDTASIVKVDILATLLLQTQDSGGLSSAQKALATSMIEQSDNDAASTLWNEIGGADGLNAANRTFGLTGTTGGSNGNWGLTQTTAADQLTLLQVVFGDDSPLDSASQKYLQGLMGQVESDQAWGVSAAADSGTATELKNGWLQRSQSGLWDVNSIGKVTVDGHSVLIAVVSDGGSTEAGSISLVESVASAAANAITSVG
ncbi:MULTISPECIES: serine hydrolase [Streptacidiphilus]|uniref:Serine hydrolase n=1 Tax=Streptacidiphilus cavernicola TaxID=3342716 RepID=A0ABV6UEX8_9ACTN|nr:serine hydrolase [Streptacidiphilus jeojiense]